MTDRMKQALTNFIFPLLLFLYPFLKIGQGIDLTDSSYGLVNYLFFPNAGQEWTVATWLANVLGALFIRLPFGDTFPGALFLRSLPFRSGI